jgi:hypothetical protein
MPVVWGDGVGIAASKQFTVCSFVRESTMTLTATTIPNFPFSIFHFLHLPKSPTSAIIGGASRQGRQPVSCCFLMRFRAVLQSDT